MVIHKKIVFACVAFVSLCSCDSLISYVCFNKNRTRSVLFSYNDQGVYWNHVLFFYKERQQYFDELHGIKKRSFTYRDTLEPHMHSGDYNITNTENELTLRFIQDGQHSRIENADGDFVKYDTDSLFKDIYSRGYAITVTAVIPSIQTYIFSKQRKELTVQYKKLPAVRHPTEDYYWIKSPHKEKHWLERGAKLTSVKSIGYLTEQEIQAAFFSDNNNESSFRYPHCEKKIGIFGKFLHWLEAVTFH